jgi:hypothetical protein
LNNDKKELKNEDVNDNKLINTYTSKNNNLNEKYEHTLNEDKIHGNNNDYDMV